MIYKAFEDLKLSQLGLGAMRLPTCGSDGAIDENKTEEMVDYAMANGINYYDTAWGYHSGNSELVMGKLLKKYPRDSYYLASKFPGYDLSNMDKVAEIFEKQLIKCQVDHFDFYLFHNVCEMNIEQYLDPKYGIYDYLIAQKKAGRIRHLGFSAHGNYDVIVRFLDAYGDDMEFCQLQVNYLDWNFQQANKKAELLKAHHIPLWVMEPLRGGKLAALDQDYVKALHALRPDHSVPAWAFRFLQSLPETTVILSGMSDMAQLQENIRIFETEQPLNQNETDTLFGIADSMIQRAGVPCTGCHYCTTHCPMGLDIPSLLKLYNEHCYAGGGFLAHMALASMSPDKRPSACLGCRSCEAVCPQNIKISEAMSDFVTRL